MKLILPFIAMLCASCAAPDHGSPDLLRRRPAIPWKESMVRGYSFDSIPDRGILAMGFPKEGNFVMITIGDRKEAIASPAWSWSIDPSGAMRLSDNSGKTEALLELIEFRDDDVTVRDGRELIHYKRAKGM